MIWEIKFKTKQQKRAEHYKKTVTNWKSRIPPKKRKKLGAAIYLQRNPQDFNWSVVKNKNRVFGWIKSSKNVERTGWE